MASPDVTTGTSIDGSADVSQQPGADRLDDTAVEQRLGHLDELLSHLEQYPGPTADAAREAVAALTDVYGEALARVVDRASEAMAERLASDELLGHLLVLHDIHPEPVEARVRRALDVVQQRAGRQGGSVELDAIDGDVARVRLSSSGGGCGCSSGTDELEQVVRESVLALAPELSSVEPVIADAGRESSVIPVEALLSRTATTGRAG